MQNDETLSWSADRDPREVMVVFCQRFESIYRETKSLDRERLRAKTITDEELMPAVEEIYRAVRLLCDLIADAKRYTSSRKFILEDIALDFFIMITLELGTPLVTVEGYCKLIMEHSVSDDRESLQYREIIASRFDKIDKLIKTIFSSVFELHRDDEWIDDLIKSLLS